MCLRNNFSQKHQPPNIFTLFFSHSNLTQTATSREMNFAIHFCVQAILSSPSYLFAFFPKQVDNSFRLHRMTLRNRTRNTT